MIALDTNVLVRTLVNDDPKQAKKVRDLLDGLSPERPGFIGTVVLVETYWVLTRAYGLESPKVRAALSTLGRSAEIVLQDRATVLAAIRSADAGADFADALIDASAREAGCREVATFDMVAARKLGWRAL